jgi:hypothetical protein
LVKSYRCQRQRVQSSSLWYRGSRATGDHRLYMWRQTNGELLGDIGVIR